MDDDASVVSRIYVDGARLIGPWDRHRKMSLHTPIRLIAFCSLCAFVLIWQHTACLASWNLNLAWVLATRGIEKNVKEELVRAEKRSRQALQLQPHRAGAWMVFGYLALLRENREAMQTGFRKALEIDRSQPLANLTLAGICVSEGQIDEAAAHYSAVGDAYSLVHLGDFLAGSRPGRAQSYYERAIACQPGIRVPHTQLGVLLLKEGRLDAALIQFKHALDADPAYGWSWYNIARTCLEAGRPEECLKWTTSARNKFPRDAELITGLQRLEAQARNARPDADPWRQGQ